MKYRCPYCQSTKRPAPKTPGCGMLLLYMGLTLIVIGSGCLLFPLLLLLRPSAATYCPECGAKIG